MTNEMLDLWTIYQHPDDYPGEYVARKFSVGWGKAEASATEMFVADTLAEIRALIPPGMFCLKRDPRDEPHIVETWL